MSEITLSLSLSNETDTNAGLFIEQEQAPTTDGRLSRGGMYNAIQKLIDGEEIDEADCLGDFGVWVYVYRYDLSLNYKLRTSYGTLSAKVNESTLAYSEKLLVSMEEEVSLKYPNFGIQDTRWLGGLVWDEAGGVTTQPGYTEYIDKIIFDKPVYGTLIVTYTINRDKYGLGLPKRADAQENKYSAVTYAVFKGGIEWLEIEPPTGAEETDEKCTGGGGTGTIEPPEDSSSIPVSVHADRFVDVDYCTQNITDIRLIETVEFETVEDA